MLHVKNHIILDQISSWPKNIIELIKSNKSDLQHFINEELNYLSHSKGNNTYRFKPRINPYKENWLNILEQLDLLLKDQKLIGFHCTRLIFYEIDDITKNGLRPLSSALVNQKLNEAFSKGYLPKEIKEKLIKGEDIKDVSRIGIINFFHTLSELRNASGLNNLLNYWGGEAINWSSSDREILHQFGIPSIVIASFNTKDFLTDYELSKRLVNIYLKSKYFSWGFSSTQVGTVKVIRIIRMDLDSKLFESLTGFSKWGLEE